MGYPTQLRIIDKQDQQEAYKMSGVLNKFGQSLTNAAKNDNDIVTGLTTPEATEFHAGHKDFEPVSLDSNEDNSPKPNQNSKKKKMPHCRVVYAEATPETKEVCEQVD